MDPLRCIRNGFANPAPPDSHFRVACNSRHESSMTPKALKFATLQKKMAPIPPQSARRTAREKNISREDQIARRNASTTAKTARRTSSCAPRPPTRRCPAR